MFFALSGFLVAGSLERCKTLLTILGLRVIRIYLVLAVEVVLSAFLIGASVTTYPLRDYFTDPLLFHYLRNSFGDIHFFLPGVFQHQPMAGDGELSAPDRSLRALLLRSVDCVGPPWRPAAQNFDSTRGASFSRRASCPAHAQI